MKNIEYDGHVHTPFCPHGSREPLERYIEKALQLGYQGISFCEHAPLPKDFPDPTPQNDSGMSFAALDTYITAINDVRQRYQNDIDIQIGLEVDFIEGFEANTKRLLDEYGPFLDDAILSVHFLYTQDAYGLVDYNLETFQSLTEKLGGIEALVGRYYETLLLSIAADLGKYKPRRLGHMSLVRKFQKAIALPDDAHWFDKILAATKKEGLSLDINGAGVSKPMCEEPYPPVDIIQKAERMGIPLIYGSDAHHPDGLGQGREALSEVLFDINHLG